MKTASPIQERFWKFVEPMMDDRGCWEWNGYREKRYGYGLFRAPSMGSKAHRVSWTLSHGAIPAGMLVCHRCDNPPCVNPAHLFLGTQYENIQDMLRKKRGSFGARHPRARRTEETIRQIWEWSAQKVTKVEMARRLNVTIGAIYGITKGQTWRHLPIQQFLDRRRTEGDTHAK